MIYLMMALFILCLVLTAAGDGKLFFYWIVEAGLLALLIAAALAMG